VGRSEIAHPDILFVFFIIDHKRRIIRHFNVTSHPSAQWVIQQLRDAFPFDQIPKYLIMDRDKIKFTILSINLVFNQYFNA